MRLAPLSPYTRSLGSRNRGARSCIFVPRTRKGARRGMITECKPLPKRTRDAKTIKERWASERARSIDEVLISGGKLTWEELRIALDLKKNDQHTRLGEVLLSQNLVSGEDLAQKWPEQRASSSWCRPAPVGSPSPVALALVSGPRSRRATYLKRGSFLYRGGQGAPLP